MAKFCGFGEGGGRVRVLSTKTNQKERTGGKKQTNEPLYHTASKKEKKRSKTNDGTCIAGAKKHPPSPAITLPHTLSRSKTPLPSRSRE